MHKIAKPSRIRPEVLKVKQWMVDGREKLLKQHRDGSPGIQVCNHLTELLDTVVVEIFESALSQYGEQASVVRSRIALVPYGGFGRREMAPYSDLDLMLLHSQGSLPLVSRLAQRLVRDFSDLGVDLGFSVRTLRQATHLAARDPVVFTSLVDTRFLGGSVRLYTQLLRSLKKMTRRRSQSLITMVEQARHEERLKYGETVYLLEPNLKRSRGGLRDLQLLRWVGYTRFGQSEPKNLERRGHLSPTDYNHLRKAQEFLLKVRNELHFHAQTACDGLARGDQVRLADLYGHTGREGLLPVEEFMQDYFSHTSRVREVVDYFVDGARWRYPRLRRSVALLSSHRIGSDFRAGPTYISATHDGLHKVRHNLADVLRLMELTGRYDCRIDHPTWCAIREAMTQRSDHEVDQKAADRFLSLLSHPNQLGRLLRRLHELRVLGQLVPGFEHARCLLQFNEYHKYTVDEHSLRAVQRATEFAQNDTILGQAYREIKQKDLLHLALLVHDLGKGFAEDHSEVGARLAIDVAEALFLNEQDTETLRFLVHRHLMLSHLAFRRDTSDEAVVLEHTAEIGSPAMLRMMFVLTCADLAAVGPGVLNEWKQDVLTQLYVRMIDQLSGGIAATARPRIDRRRAGLIDECQKQENAKWLSQQIETLPLTYLDGPSHATILADLQKLYGLPEDRAIAWGRFLPDRNAAEYTIGAYENRVEGIFHRLTGAISGQGMEILSADIHTLADHLCLDRFYVQDNDYRGEPPPERFEHVSQSLVRALMDDSGTTPTFRRTWQDIANSDSRVLTSLPTKVRIDNTTSDLYSIIDVFAHDRPGLLFAIARTLFELDLSVATAKIGTYLDQVVDVFYVTESSGKKLDHETRIRHVRDALTEAINRFE